MPELLIRPSRGDHLVLDDLLAPTPRQRRPIDRIVLNAHDAARDERLLAAVRDRGVPLLIDPLTTLLQSEVSPEDPWVRAVPYGRSARMNPKDLSNPFALDELVAQSLEFQVEHGATAVIPPYFYADQPDSPAFAASLTAIARTARRMRIDGCCLPIVPLLCVQLRAFSQRSGWQRALDRFLEAAVDVGPQAIALYLSPLGRGQESYAKLLHAHLAARHLRAAGVPTIAWRQGVYGPSLVAAGLDGYECGMGVGERSDVASFAAGHRPAKPGAVKSGGFAPSGIYLPGLRRSVPLKVGRVLLAEPRLLGRIVCDSITCCPKGAESMLASKGRRHAVRSRARELAELAAMPSEAWRLNEISKQTASAYVTADKANQVLAAASLPDRIKLNGYEALQRVAEQLTHAKAQACARRLKGSPSPL